MNKHLMETVISINRRIKKVFLLSLYEHFVAENGCLITPGHKYFREDGHLTKLGCMTMRECIFRETGMKTYWFDNESESA